VRVSTRGYAFIRLRCLSHRVARVTLMQGGVVVERDSGLVRAPLCRFNRVESLLYSSCDTLAETVKSTTDSAYKRTAVANSSAKCRLLAQLVGVVGCEAGFAPVNSVDPFRHTKCSPKAMTNKLRNCCF